MKTLLAILLSIGLIASTVPAQAGNSEEVTIGVLGGILGGLIIGGAINEHRHHHHRHHHRVRGRAYIYNEPYCVMRWVQEWDPYLQQYVNVRRTICN